jgi:ATP-binding cassette subfamily F protein 3
MAIIVQASGVQVSHGGNRIFTDVTFDLQDGDRAAIVGPNGSGKSTLFRLLTRDIHPERGQVTQRRGATIGFLTQEPNLPVAMPVRSLLSEAAGNPDAIEREIESLQARLAEPLDDDEMASVLDALTDNLTRLDEVLASDNSSELAEVLTALRVRDEILDRPFGTLSGGEKKIVVLARFVINRPDLLLLDEPENHLDADAKIWLENWLAQYKGAVGLISHDRYMIDRVANEIFEIEDGGIEVYPGNYSQFQQLKRDRLARALELRELAEREFKKLKESAEDLTQWARQNPKFATRAEAMRRRVDEERARLDAEKMPVLTRRQIKVEFEIDRGGEIVLVANAAAKSFGEREVIQPFDLEIRHGERVGIVGPNGAGKTTLFRMATGRDVPTSGLIRMGAAIVPGYYAQEQETLDPNATPIDVIRRIKPLNEQQALSYLVGFLFERDDVMNRIGLLSGGERSRLQIAMLILQGANFLLLDEPTNNLDLPSVEVLEEALLSFPGTILTISHDRYYLDKVCTRILALDDGVIADYAGGFSWYQSNPDKGVVLTRTSATARSR